MRCWCARCKMLVPVVHLERWGTDESGEGIVRGACAICGGATGEIGVYAAPAAQRRSEHAWPERVRVATTNTDDGARAARYEQPTHVLTDGEVALSLSG